MKIIAGPCQHSNLKESLDTAEFCRDVIAKELPKAEYYFKASYYKANRTHVDSIRGPGLQSTLKDFKALKAFTHEKIKILTDVHETKDISAIVSFQKHFDINIVDVLQIPAFLCRQSDLIEKACSTNMIVNIKKGQFLAPWDVAGILSKTQKAKEVWITERGTCFGYNTLVVDFTGIHFMLMNYKQPIIFDATHSVQKPGGLGETSGGNREYVIPLIRAAAALGVRNFFMEVHRNPNKAPSDGPNSLDYNGFVKAIKTIKHFSSL